MRGPVRFGAYVYMLECADGSYYVGLTRRQYLETRISEHEQGLISGYTSVRRPVKLVWAEHIPRLIDAIAAERRIKGWSRAKKQALIRGDWDYLRQLAKRRGGAPALASRVVRGSGFARAPHHEGDVIRDTGREGPMRS